MTTTIRGKSGKDSVRALLDEHDKLMETMDRASTLEEPLRVVSATSEEYLEVSALEVFSLLQARKQRVETKLENLGLKIGDEVVEGGQ